MGALPATPHTSVGPGSVPEKNGADGTKGNSKV